MLKPTLTEIIALALATLHFGMPLAYYWYAKSRWLKKPWSLKIDENYKPRVSIIIPTYNEVKHVAKRLDNIYQQDYPRELIEIIVVDSASTDGTPEIVRKWIEEHKDIRIKLVTENTRRGKTPAIIKTLRSESLQGEIIVFTDADAVWEYNALSNLVRYFSDDSIGVISGSIYYEGKTIGNVYRSYYNTIRIAESKHHSTPVHNGPLIAIRADIIRRHGIPDFPGSDDSCWGSFVAFAGYRAIQVDDVIVKEYVENTQFNRMVRRAQHLIINFLKTKKWNKDHHIYRYDRKFETIWRLEWWLHIANPWLAVISAGLLLVSCLSLRSLFSFIVLTLGVSSLIYSTYRMWLFSQLYLIMASIKTVRSIDIAWSK